MRSYLIRRLLLMIPTFLGITFMVFAITRMTPGGPVERVLMDLQMGSFSSGEGDPSGLGSNETRNSQPLSDDQITFLKNFYVLDKPIIPAYFEWLGKVLRLDLGESTRYWDPVWDIIASKLPVSIYYGLLTFLFSYGISIPLGVLKALRHKTTIDTASSIFVFIGFALPNFVVGIGLLLLFSYHLEWFPMGGFVSDEFEDLSTFDQIFDVIYHSLLPLAAWMTGSFAGITLLMKNILMDYLAEDFVRTAMAKGVPFRQAVIKHAIRNAIIPLASGFGHIISIILTGALLLEKVFNIDGLGLLAYDSTVERDFPVVMGILVISSVLLMLGNLLSDICVAIVDPRVKYT